jgi:hypothetical protein
MRSTSTHRQRQGLGAQPEARVDAHQHDGAERLGGGREELLFFVVLEEAQAPRRLAQGLHPGGGVVALVLPPLPGPVVEGPQNGQLAIDQDRHAGLDPGALVALKVEGADLAQAPAGERRLHPVDALPVGAYGEAALVGLRPGEEQLSGLVDREVRPLGPADAGFALEDARALHARDLAGHRPVDRLPDADDVALALVDEVEIPGLASEVDPVTASGHPLDLQPQKGI